MIISKIKKITKGIVLEDEPMSQHTSYGIGGIGNTYFRNEWRSFVETSDEDEVSILHGAR